MSIPNYLARSQAGLRFIAQAKLFNEGGFERLQEYVASHYTDEALEKESVSDRIAALQTLHQQVGRIRVSELVNADKHRTVMILETEKGGLHYARVKVLEEYPHKVSQFLIRPHGGQE